MKRLFPFFITILFIGLQFSIHAQLDTIGIDSTAKINPVIFIDGEANPPPTPLGTIVNHGSFDFEFTVTGIKNVHYVSEIYIEFHFEFTSSIGDNIDLDLNPVSNDAFELGTVNDVFYMKIKQRDAMHIKILKNKITTKTKVASLGSFYAQGTQASLFPEAMVIIAGSQGICLDVKIVVDDAYIISTDQLEETEELATYDYDPNFFNTDSVELKNNCVESHGDGRRLNTEQSTDNQINIQPNPATKEIKLIFKREISEYFVSITNIQGKEALSGKYHEFQNNMIDISQLTKGVYIIQVYNESESVVSKFIKTN